MIPVKTKPFPTGAVISVITGRLVAENGITGVYEVLNWMTGESVYTNQLPRIGREAVPVIIAKHPRLQGAIDDAAQVTEHNWRGWLTIWIDRYGDEIAVPKFNHTQHERIDPRSELAEVFPPSKIIEIGTESPPSAARRRR